METGDIGFLIYDQHSLPKLTQIPLLSGQLSSIENDKAGALTDNHQQFLLLFDDVDLENWSQAGDVSQRVLDNIQTVQTLFRAHQNYLQAQQENTISNIIVVIQVNVCMRIKCLINA